MHRRVSIRRFRIGLLAFLVLACGVGAIVGLAVRQYLRPEFVANCAGDGECRWEAKWRVVGRQQKLLYIFFLPDHAQTEISGVNWEGSPPLGGHIACHPEGLFLYGERVETNERRRVFVFTQNREMRPIELEPDEIAQITTDSVDTLERSQLWKTKIRPVVVEEEWNIE